MIVLITGATHTGKTLLAQKLLQKYHFPYLSIDHLKMGLIRSGQTALTPTSTEKELTAYLWPIVREMVKTAMENEQDLIVEGCYIPFDWKKDFEEHELACIRYLCLVMSEDYICGHFADIRRHACAAERRMNDEGCTMERLLADNAAVFRGVKSHGLPCIFINDGYDFEAEL